MAPAFTGLNSKNDKKLKADVKHNWVWNNTDNPPRSYERLMEMTGDTMGSKTKQGVTQRAREGLSLIWTAVGVVPEDKEEENDADPEVRAVEAVEAEERTRNKN